MLRIQSEAYPTPFSNENDIIDYLRDKTFILRRTIEITPKCLLHVIV